MAWERRVGGGTYYTRSRRVRDRVVREYLGCGLLGQLAAENDAEAREERRAEQDSPREVEATLAALGSALDQLIPSVLVEAGYHRHKGEWRLKRAR